MQVDQAVHVQTGSSLSFHPKAPNDNALTLSKFKQRSRGREAVVPSVGKMHGM